MTMVKSGMQLAGVADLALLAAVKPGFVPGAEGFTYGQRLRLLLRTLNAIRLAGRETPLFDSPFPDSVGRFGMLQSFRYALVPPEIGSAGEAPAPADRLPPGVWRLFLSVTFDGGWEPYLRVVYRDLGPLLDTIFANCDGYRPSWKHGYDGYIRWVRQQDVPAGLFYAESPFSVVDQRYFEAVERLQRSTDDPARARELIAGHAEPAVPRVQTVLQRFMAAPPAVRLEALANHLRALKGLYDLRAAYPANGPTAADGDDQTLLRFAQRAMPEFRALMATGAVPVPPDNRPSVDWLLGPSMQKDHPVDDRSDRLPRPLHALQAGIVSKAPSATHGALFLLAVSDAAQARAWLATGPVTPGDQQPLKRDGLLRQLAFTREGLQAIGALPPPAKGTDDADASLARLPQEFIDGMEARAGLLGDVRGNHPDRWQRPRYRGQGPELELRSVHLVLMVRLADPDHADPGLHPRLLALQQQLDATPGLHRLATEPMRSWPQDDGDVREHFGFRDGLSQPAIRNAGARADPVWDDGVRPGDVLLGHPNSRGGGVYPPRPDPLLDNGSFLVLRKIAQHVDTWQQAVRAGGRKLDPHFDRRPEQQQRHTLGLVAARLMGRSLDGQPAVDLGHASHSNRFNYDLDTVGSGCPFAAHVRRANPRTRDDQGVPDVPRLLRRGMSYGPRWSPGDDTAERGLFFMAYVGSIAEQFEVVQRWLAGGNSTGVASTHSDPLLGVPQAGRPRQLQWLDEQGQVQRVDLGEQPLTTLRWGLYLFVPSIEGLRHIAAGPAAAPDPRPQPLTGEPYDPRNPAFDAWRRVVQDADQRDTLWRRVRDSGGQLQTAYGLLVAGKDPVLDILRDDGQRYTVRGYGRRFGDSVGPGYLGMDRVGDHAGHDERAEASGINAAIVAIDEATAFEAAARHTRARLQALAAGLPAPPPGTPKVVSVDVLDLGEQVLARLCTEWFGVPDGTHLKAGGTAAQAEPPPRCPRDLVDVARYIFGPHPSVGVSAEGRARGQAIQAATLAWQQQQLGPDGQGQPPAPLPRLAQAVHQGLGHLGLPVVADTLAGILLGFTPSVFGNYSNLMRAWIDRGTDGARTLWDLQAMLLQAGAPIRGYEAANEVLRPALIAQMRSCPIPTSVWREVAGTPVQDVTTGTGVPGDPTGESEPAKIVIGLHGVMQDPDAPELLMWGGAWRGAEGYEDLKTLHACPGHGLSTGVLMGIVSALVLAGSLRVSPSPTIVYWVGEG